MTAPERREAPSPPPATPGLRVGEVLWEAWTAFVPRLGRLTVAALGVFVVGLSVGAARSLAGGFLGAGGGAALVENLFFLLPLLGAALGLSAVGAEAALGRRVGFQAFAVGFRVLPQALGTAGLLLVLAMTGSVPAFIVWSILLGVQAPNWMLALVPTLVPVAWLLALSPLVHLSLLAVVVGGAGPFAAIGQAWRLGRGRRWKTFAVVLIAYLAPIVGILAFCVGYFVGLAFSSVLMATLYLRLGGTAGGALGAAGPAEGPRPAGGGEPASPATA